MNQLTIPSISTVDLITDDALTQKKYAVETMQAITTCDSDAAQAEITAAASMAKALERQMEETRTSFTKPLNDELKRINAIAKGYSDTLKLERERIERMSSIYQNAKIAKINALKAQEEADLREAAKNATTDQLRAIATRQAELDQPVKVAGAIQREEIDFEVHDMAGLVEWCLRKGRLDMLKIEPRRTEIKAWFSIPGMEPIPGVTVTRGVKLHSKAS